MLTQKTLHEIIADLWTMSASMNAAGNTNELQLFESPGGHSVLAAPVRPEWLKGASESLQKAAEDLASLLDDETPVPKPPTILQPVLSIVRDIKDELPDFIKEKSDPVVGHLQKLPVGELRRDEDIKQDAYDNAPHVCGACGSGKRWHKWPGPPAVCSCGWSSDDPQPEGPKSA